MKGMRLAILGSGSAVPDPERGNPSQAVVVDDEVAQLREPAVRGRIEGRVPEPGTEVTVRLERADPAAREVSFSVPS